MTSCKNCVNVSSIFFWKELRFKKIEGRNVSNNEKTVTPSIIIYKGRHTIGGKASKMELVELHLCYAFKIILLFMNDL